MTFKEKLAMEHPDRARDGACLGCPSTYGYESENGESACVGRTCEDCWDREMPETEPEEKENKNMATTRKTKSELLDELQKAKDQIDKLNRDLKDAKEREQIQDAADKVGQMRDAFINAGFTREEAMSLVRTAVESALGGR